MATMSSGNECTGSIAWRHAGTRSVSAPSYRGCAGPTPGRGATSRNLSAAEVCPTNACPTTAEVCTATAEVCTATTGVCTATTMTAAMVLRGSIGSKR
jgi:hypothetical protein